VAICATIGHAISVFGVRDRLFFRVNPITLPRIGLHNGVRIARLKHFATSAQSAPHGTT
jgi:hypothetical protein